MSNNSDSNPNPNPGPKSNGDVINSFPSFAALRAAHSELLKRQREANASDTFAAVIEFMQRAQATGAWLDSEEDREAAQSLLDYWAAILYRAGYEPPEALLAEFDPALAPELADKDCPYLGLDAFREANTSVFFGRQRLVQEMTNRLKEARLLAVVGPSGSGKSSLVMAGLLPALKTGAAPGSQAWRYYPPMMPGSHPLANLARLLRAGDTASTEQDAAQVECFRNDSGHLLRLMNEQETPAVLVIDQFEELFTLCLDNQERRAFVDNLMNLIQAADSKHIVILTMRIDFEHYVARLPDLYHHFEATKVHVIPLGASELREAIEAPAKMVGLKFEEGVIDALIQDVLGEPAALPLLQFTLLKLWENRERNRVTWAAYRRLGGGRQALERSANALYESMIPEDQVTLKRILLLMVQPGEGLEVTSHRIRRETVYQAGEARDRVDRVLDKLIQSRLVRCTAGDTPADTQIEVAHEALVRNWRELVGWLEDARETMRQRRRLTAAAEQWEASGRDAGALLRGTLLNEAQNHADLNELEAAFVQASLQADQQAKIEEEEARQRELKQARQLFEAEQHRAEAERQRAEQQELSTRRLLQLLEEQRRRAIAESQRVEQKTKYVRRLSWLLGILAFAALLLVVAIVLAGTQWNAANDAAATAKAEAVRANAEVVTRKAAESRADNLRLTAEAAQQIAESKTHALQSRGLAEFALKALGKNNLDLALTLIITAGEIYAPSLPDVQRAQAKIAYATASRRIFNSDAPVYSVAISPDGSRALSGASDGSVKLWSVETGEMLRRFTGHTGAVRSVAFSPQGEWAVSGSADKSLILWDVESGKSLRHFTGHTDAVLGVAFSPDGNKILSASKDKSLILWDADTGKDVRHFTGHTDWVWCVAFSPDGRMALSGSEDRTLILWDIETGKIIRRFQGHDNAVMGVAISPDGSQALSGSADRTLILWDIKSAGLLYRFSGHSNAVSGVVFTPDGRKALSCSEGKTLILWDLETRQPLRTLWGHTDWVWSVAVSPDGNSALSGSSDKSLRLWDIESGYETSRTWVGGHPSEKHTGEVLDVAISPDRKMALSGSTDNSLILWDIASGAPITRMVGHTRQVYSAAFSPDGRTALSGSADNNLILWDIASGQMITRLVRHTGRVYSVAFSPDGSTALSGSDDGLILWDIASRTVITRLVGHTGPVYSVAFSPDGSTALSGLSDGLIMWDIAKKTVIRRFGQDTPAYSVAFSSGGRTALSNSNYTLILWDVESGAKIRDLSSPNLPSAWGITLSPEGRVLSSFEDGSLGLWDTARGTEIHRWLGIGRAYRVAFVDEHTALVGKGDGSLILWDVENGKTIRSFGSAGAVRSMAVSRDRRTALLGLADGHLILWDIQAKEPIRQLEGHTASVESVAISPDGRRGLSGAADGQLLLWNIESGAVISRLLSFTSTVHSVAFSPQGDRVLAGVDNKSPILWEVRETGQVTLVHRFESGPVYSLAFSPDGRQALSGSITGTVNLWDLDGKKKIRSLSGHPSIVRSLVYSDSMVLSASEDGTLIQWNIGDGKVLRSFSAPSSLLSLAIGPDGRTLLAGLASGGLALIDAENGETLYTFTGHADKVSGVAFLDNRTALSGSEDGSLRLWQLSPAEGWGKWIREHRAGRALSCAEKELYEIETGCPPEPTPTPAPSQTPAPTAMPVPAGTAQLGDNSGKIVPGQSQVWTYVGSASEFLMIRTQAVRPAYDTPAQEQRERALLNVVFTMRKPDGTSLRQETSSQAGPVGNIWGEMLVLPVTGTYQIEVSSAVTETGGAYTLTLKPAVSQEIAFGQTIKGVVESGSSYLWKFKITTEQLVTIALEQDNNSGLDAYLLLLGSDGKILTADDDSGGNRNAKISLPLQPGDYIIVAKGYSSSAGAYKLTLTKGTP